MCSDDDAQSKPFNQLTDNEAREIVRSIVAQSTSDEEVRRRLNESGFDGDAAAIQSRGEGTGFYTAMVMVFGPPPNHSTITA